MDTLPDADDVSRFERFDKALESLAEAGDADALLLAEPNRALDALKRTAVLNLAMQQGALVEPVVARIAKSYPQIKDLAGLVQRIRVQAVIERLG